MDEAMIVRGMADRTRETYLWAVTGLAKFYHRSPDRITDDEVQAYVLHLIRDRQRSWSTCNIVVHGLRFLYHTTLKRERTTFCIPSPRQPGTLPTLLSRDEVQRLIAQASNEKYRTMLMTTYAAGLRLSEVLHLQIRHIDSARMAIRVEQGKGRQDRDTLLPPRLLEALRAYWTVHRPAGWLFPGKDPSRPMDPSSLQKAYHTAKRRAGIRKSGGIHTLALLRDASARSGRRSPHDPALAGPSVDHDDDAVLAPHPRVVDDPRRAAGPARRPATRASGGLSHVSRVPSGHGGHGRLAPAGTCGHCASARRCVSAHPPPRDGPAPGASSDRGLPHRQPWRPSGDV
jgi:site-specific recombinase XerD